MENVMLGAIYLASKKLRAVLMVPQLWQEFCKCLVCSRGKREVGLFQRICKCFTNENDSLKVTKVNGVNIGFAFFFHFSVHALKTDHKEGEDTRVLPVHYSNNYFSLVLSEIMPIKITFKVPPGVTP